jgi:ABC-type multidrug transport system ATPase subunit
MVELKSFKLSEQDDDETMVVASERGAARGEGRAGETADDGAGTPQRASIMSAASSASVRSAASSTGSTTVAGGGNLTTDTSSRSSSASVSSIRLAASERPASGQQRPTAGDVPSGAPSHDGTSLTLSSNEEFQSARIDLNKEDEDDTLEDVPLGPSNNDTENGATDDEPNETVTKIQIEHKGETMPASTSVPMQQQQQQQQFTAHRASQNSPLTPRLIRMPRAQTSPSPLSQIAGPGGKFSQATRAGNKPPPAAAHSSSINGDNVSQYSLQYKNQPGSNQFEIRWYNICLFARPKSLLPTFITDNCLYRSLAPASWPNSSGQQHEATLFFDDHIRPPYSPPLKHYPIPPTIDEQPEMKCPSQEQGQAKMMRLGSASSSSSSLSSVAAESPTTPATATPAASPVPLAVTVPEQKQQKQQQPSSPPPASNASSSSPVKCVLNNISGQVFSGQMTAILGPSGVGKTSLLNSLTGRNTLDGTGRVSLIGAYNSKRMSVVTVPQNDVLPNKLTAHEDLYFTSRLKNPQAKFDHQRNIDRLVKHLHMDKFLHTRIDKLSGGEARRLSIARELLSSPDILILDEPTSGLDANTCKKIITALRDIVEHSDNILDKPMSIIITIHQPQQEVYHQFHRVYVMAMGGRVVYEGPPELLMPTIMEHSSLSRICPVEQLNENPAIVAIEVASGEYGSQVIEELANHHEGQVYEEFTGLAGGGAGSLGGLAGESPMLTPRSLRMHRSPNIVSRFELHRRRLNSLGDGSIGRPTPILAKRQLAGGLHPSQWDRVSNVTSVSYASTYDADLPEPTSKLKVDKRLRRSVVMKSHFISHTLTLISRCWLLTTRDMFLMSIRILGFLLVAGGTVQIFSHALDPDEHQCPQFESEIDDMPDYLSQVRTRLTGLLDMLRQGNSTHLFFFHLLLCIVMVTSALTGLVFPLQMRMFIREYKNGWYSPASFIMSQTIAELPVDILGPIITLLITYPLCHQPDSMYHWRLIAYGLVLVLCSIICKSQAQIIGAVLMNSVENSVFISCVAVTLPALLSGIPIRIDQMILPLRLASYTSFLRYAFESLLELRYGFGMCPCDSSIVNGPLRASLQAVPPHLENLATGLLELSLPTNATKATDDQAGPGGGGALMAGGDLGGVGTSEHENVFLKFLRLITDASNQFASNSEINDCERYRSLYLINMGIKNNTFIDWIAVMVLMFIISRFLTYFAVKTVIKLRRS